MSTLNEFITFEHETEHVLEHDLSKKSQFSSPKIYTANGNLKKRWYVYFSFRNPKTGKLERMKNVYGKANQFSTKEGRLSVLTKYRQRLLKLLKLGYNPFENNNELFLMNKEKLQNKSALSGPATQTIIEKNTEIVDTIPKVTLRKAFDFALKLKEKQTNAKTRQDYKYQINALLTWLKKQHPETKTIDQLDKKLVTGYLNNVLFNSSARNRNNHRITLSSIMQVLEDNDIIAVNFIKKIPILKTIPERNKTYTLEMQEEIFAYLKIKDPILLLYIKFISYNLLRPIEACRIRIKDINLKNNTIQFKAKNSPLKTKIIPKILVKELPDISKIDKDFFLFTPDKIGGKWDATENNRRDNFSKRFKTVVKDHFKLGKDYGLYSFRHTFITKLYRELVKKSSPFHAKSTLMQITGHKSMTALEKYLRDIDTELPEDYSDMLK